MLGFGGGNPLIFSKIAANDATGKFVTLSITSLGVGSMVGPAVAGMILANNVGGLLQWFVIGSLLLSAVCMWFSGGED
jgi:predicted MFS family arabinose efflux permease